MMKNHVIKTVLFSFLFIGVFVIQLFSQANEDIYLGKKGSELITLIVSSYKTSTVLTYNDARDQLWGALAKHNKDSLHCVYTNYTVYISPSASNPRTDAYNKGIDCEHTWPQSLGAEGNAKSDMHHLYPTITQANSARGNLPFAEISDDQTDLWYWTDKILTTKPTSNINQYSEKDNAGYFEPREDHKGNVARTMFYFYTMYSGQADLNFFNTQKKTLYQWHYQDPVDDQEIWRNDFIAGKQNGKKNPFILDSTLIRRAYFPQYKDTSTSSINFPSEIEINVFWNDQLHQFQIQNIAGNISLIEFNIFDQNGKLIETINRKAEKSGTQFTVSKLNTGIYYYKLLTKNCVQSGKFFVIEAF